MVQAGSRAAEAVAVPRRRLPAAGAGAAGWSRKTVSVPESRENTAAQVAGYLAAASIAVSAVGLVYRPVRTIPVAIVVALIAVVMAGPSNRLPSLAVLVGGIAFVVGMTIAVATESPLW
jgi:hypothetical protein